MKGVEIISVRIPTGPDQHVMEDLRAICHEVRESSLAQADVYANGVFPGDLAIILSWEEMPPKGERTGLGKALSAALKRFGLVDHSVWVKAERGLKAG
jgi:hypothetical protein